MGFFYSSWQWRKNLCSKDFTSNLRNIFTGKWLWLWFLQICFYLLFFLSYKPKAKIRFSASWWSGNEKYFCFLFIANRALLQGDAEFKRLLWRNFLTYSCSYYGSMVSNILWVIVGIIFIKKFAKCFPVALVSRFAKLHNLWNFA